MDLTEGVGESSSPTKRYLGGGNYDLRSQVFNGLMESANAQGETVTNPEAFREQLDAHFNRLPPSYALDINLDRVEDVLLHQKLLAMAKDPENRPVYNIRFLENICTSSYGNDDQPFHTIPCAASSDFSADEGVFPPSKRDCAIDFEPCFKLEDLNLEMRTSKGIEEKCLAENLSIRQRGQQVAARKRGRQVAARQQGQQVASIHEVIFSTIDKPKLLSQLSALLSDIGLNIREAHVFSTTDGYSLDVFVVDGWPVEDTDSLYKAMEIAIARSEGSWSGTSHSPSARGKAPQTKLRDWEIDKRLLKMGENIASGSCGYLHRGVYLGQDVAVKVLRSENLNETQVEEFAQEVAILREVEHRNVVRFIGACTELPSQCIVTEYMPGGSLYDYLHKNHSAMELPQLIEFAIDVSKGMEYLHQKNIIHRDLKTANLLMDSDNVVKVADFGVARFQNQGGVMTAETGTYRWMAPEVINHQPYDQKADIFSYAIVLWELVTAKVPYDTMTPLQAAIGVRQGLRPDLPKDVHPKLLDLMQRCWDTDPNNRPSFSKITVELEALLQEVKGTSEAGKSN